MNETPLAPPKRTIDFTWVDEWIDNIRPYVFVRAEDEVLIKRPNQAQRLNAQGVAIMQALLDGARIGDVLDGIGRHPQRMHDVHLFLYDVRRFLEGTLVEGNHTHAVEIEQFDLHFSKLPILSEIALNYRCNLRCTFCYAGCNCTTNPTGDDREMTNAEVKDIIYRIRHEAQVPSVSFTGGEPTLRRDLPDLVAYAHSVGLRVNLITNGTRVTADLAGRLAASGLSSAQVSLEGVTAETHDRITLVRGSFERTVAAVHNFRAAGVLVHTNTTLCGDNLHEAALMPGFVKDVLRGDRFSMNLVVPTGSVVLNERLVVPYSELGPHLEAIAEESRRVGVEFMWYSPTPMCMFNPVAHGLGNKGCSACDGLLSIGANGDLIPCSSFDESVGNVLNRSIVDVWNSPRARQHRDKFLAHPECRICEFFAICNGACPLYWRQMGFDELTELNGFAPVGEGYFEQ